MSPFVVDHVTLELPCFGSPQMQSTESRASWSVVLVLFVFVFMPGCDSQTRAEDAAKSRAISPILSWGGQSHMGYLKVELRGPNPPAQTSLLEIRVYRADGTINNYTGRMIELPPDLNLSGGVWQAFIQFPDNSQLDKGMVALLAPDGLLKLYVYRSIHGLGPCELRPIS